MTETTALTVSEMLALAAEKKRTKHWSHRRFMTATFVVAGMITGWLVWLTLISPWFFELRRSQDGVNAANASNFLAFLVFLLAGAMAGWFFIRWTSNKHLKMPKEATS